MHRLVECAKERASNEHRQRPDEDPKGEQDGENAGEQERSACTDACGPPACSQWPAGGRLPRVADLGHQTVRFDPQLAAFRAQVIVAKSTAVVATEAPRRPR